MFTILPQFCSWFGCCNINPEWVLNQTKRYSPMAKLDLDSALENIACRKHNVSSLTAAAFKKCNNDVRTTVYYRPGMHACMHALADGCKAFSIFFVLC